MEMSIKDRLSILAMSIIGMIIYLLIAYDPLDILDTSQKWIIAVIVSIAFTLLLIYQVQRIKKKMKKTTWKSERYLLTALSISLLTF
jgi:FtsH-binding integral membrane protein